MRLIQFSVLLSFLLTTNVAFACSCALNLFHPEQLFEESEAVFVGKISGGKITVVKAYKGVKEDDTFDVVPRDSMCSSAPMHEGNYLIYEPSVPKAVWTVPHMCASKIFALKRVPKSPTDWLRENRKDTISPVRLERATSDIDKTESPPFKPTLKTSAEVTVKTDSTIEPENSKTTDEKPADAVGGCQTTRLSTNFVWVALLLLFAFKRTMPSARDT